MTLALVIVGALILVVAIHNTQSDLFGALKADVPQFVIWAAAIVALGVIGFVPGLKPISRGLLGLVIVVIVLNNYRAIVAGFQSSWASPVAANPPAATTSGAAGASTSGALPAASSKSSNATPTLAPIANAPSAAAGNVSSIVQNAYGSIDPLAGFGSMAGVLLS